jgi:hypothetical protein
MAAHVAEQFTVDERLAHVEAYTQQVENRLGAVERVLQGHSEKLDRVLQSLAKQSARPEYNPREVVSFVRDVLAVAGTLAIVVIYISTNIMRAPTELMEHRLGMLERIVDPSTHIHNSAMQGSISATVPGITKSNDRQR